MNEETKMMKFTARFGKTYKVVQKGKTFRILDIRRGNDLVAIVKQAELEKDILNTICYEYELGLK